MNNSLLTNGPPCAVCGKPVKLETSKADERGKAIHEACYVLKVNLHTANQPQPKA